MEMVWPEIIVEILKNGIPLREIGINNWALSKNETLEAIDKFKKLGIPVLGGDVCQKIDSVMRLSYDNWYCNKNEEETIEEFTIRSCKKAKTYIEVFPINKPGKTYFVIVPDFRNDQ